MLLQNNMFVPQYLHIFFAVLFVERSFVIYLASYGIHTQIVMLGIIVTLWKGSFSPHEIYSVAVLIQNLIFFYRFIAESNDYFPLVNNRQFWL